MKFEHVLTVYWSKGLLISGKLLDFDTNFNDMFSEPGGFAWPTKRLLADRFELLNLLQSPNRPIVKLRPFFVANLNILFSQITSVNHTVLDFTKSNLIRLYLIKTTRGRAHALGKPSRGQRTWSNAWSAYSTNRITRAFISDYQKTHRASVREEKINYKLIKKKSFRKQRKAAVQVVKARINCWF